jgi:ferric-dicitrate binding protein FerR (iron transport regulator)
MDQRERPDLRLQDDRLDPAVEQELRELYAAPRDARYWDRLETRIMWRVGAATAAADDWAAALRGWSRVGLAAAAVVAAVLGAVAWHQRTGEAQLAYETVLESTAPMSLQVRGRPIDTTAPDEASFQFLLGH